MKKIGIVAWNTGGNSFGITMMYLDFFSNFGVVEMIMHNEIEARKDLDLLVLPGGPDVDPMRYLDENDEFSLWNGKPCLFKERFDKVLLPKYIELNIPILGICRGHQSLAVYFGGKLIQDMAESGLWHESNGDDRQKLIHDVEIDPELAEKIPNFNIQKYGKFGVNSIHHQIIDHENLPEIGKPLAVFTERTGKQIKTIEAMTYFPEYPAYTVQWHPEEIRDMFSIRLIQHLLSL